MKKGVIYTAVGEKYRLEAKESAKSLKKNNSSIPVTLFTDDKSNWSNSSVFDQITEITNSNTGNEQKFLDRLHVYKSTPYERTLALDTDTLILDDIEEVFKVLDKFDLGLCHGHNKIKRYHEVRKLGMGNPEIPYSFAPIQGGLLLYNNNSIVQNFLDELIEMYQQKNYWDDQPSIRDLLWIRSDLGFYILPREYNFNSIEDLKRWYKYGFKEAKPKIFHYTNHKNESNLLKKVSKFVNVAEKNNEELLKGKTPKIKNGIFERIKNRLFQK